MANDGPLFSRGFSNQGFQIVKGEELNGYNREEREELRAGDELVQSLEGHHRVDGFYEKIETSLELIRGKK